jgi:peptide/nickel transport system substrate-binding protein
MTTLHRAFPKKLGALAALVLATVAATAPASHAITRDAAPQGTATHAATPSGTLRIATPISVATVDPPAITTGDTFPLSTMVVESLTAFNRNGVLRPHLATSWKVSKGGTVYDFTLRRGVKFTNGETFDSRAVAYSIGRLLSPQTFNARPLTLSVIKSARTLGKYKVRLTLKEPFGALLAALSLPNAGILAPNSVTQAPNTYRTVTNPVGTGPYRIGSWRSGDRVTFVANRNYWGPKPAYNEQIYMTVPDASSRVALLRSGQVDVIANPPTSQLDALRGDSSLKIVTAPTSYMLQLLMNTTSSSQPKLRDPRVRRALTYAIDRRTIINRVLFGSAAMPTSPLAPTVFGHCRAGDFSYNPGKARQMLAAAGASGMKVKMMAPNGRYLQDYQVGQAVAGYLRAVGLDVELMAPMDFPTYTSRLYVPPARADYDLALIGFGASYNDPSQALGLFDSALIPPDGFNASHYRSNKFDGHMAAAFRSSVPAVRRAAYCKAQQNLVQFAPSVWLYVQYSPLVSNRDVSGIYGVNLWYVTTYARRS